MSEHRAHVEWQRETEGFAYETYNRSHYWSFDEVQVKATAASTNVPRAAGGTPGVDPEQAFVAALSACHMLWFLHLACKAGYVVDRYTDDAVGVMRKNAEGRVAITSVTLSPAVSFSGKRPGAEEHLRLHHEAHEQCFIANSVKSDVVCRPRLC